MAGITEKTINFIKSIIGARAKDSETPPQPICLVINGFPPDTFHVVECRVEAKLNFCNSVEATLISEKADIDMKQLVHSSAFAFVQGSTGGYVTFGGFVHEAEQMGSFSGRYFYRLMLAPKLSLLNHTVHNQVFLNRTTRQILEDILTDGGLNWDDFEFRLQNSYDKEWEYVCQYNESHFSFFSRWLEREGLYFFFEPTDEGEKLIITDTKMSHPASDPKHKLRYKPVLGLNHDASTPVLESFSSTHKRTPGSVTVKDYNYRHPSLDLSATETIDENNSGEVYIYGDHLQKPEESKRIAKVRAEGIKCRSHQFKGASNAGFLRSGSIIEVADHFRPEYNGKYLITEITHEINQQMYMVSGLQQGASERESKPAYRNTFTAIPADVQFRPLHITTRPRFHGVINAHIESEGKGNVPYLDKQGRYKVRLPFDQSERKSAKASAWLRMAQPYSGDGHGMHFPLLAGAEVLLTFIDGDPDRPIISAAVPNHANQSVVNENNNTQNRITTAGGNKLHIEDGDGSQRILMQSPTKNSWFRMGAPNDPPGFMNPRVLYTGDGTGGPATTTQPAQLTEAELDALNKDGLTAEEVNALESEYTEQEIADMIDNLSPAEIKNIADEAEEGVKIFTEGEAEYVCGGEKKVVHGNCSERIFGWKSEIIEDGSSEIVLGAESNLVIGARNHMTIGMLTELTLALKFAITITAGWEYVFEKMHISGSHNEMHELNEKIAGIKTDLATTETKMNTALQTKVLTLKEEISEVEMNSAVTLSQFAAECNQNYATKEELVPIRTSITANKQELDTQVNRISANLNDYAGVVNQTSASLNRMDGTVTTLCNSVSSLAVAQTAIVDIMTIL